MHTHDPIEWGPASVSYPDFKGTAQLDRRLTGESGFSQAGIDESKWLVIGFDLGGGERDHTATVIAVDQELLDNEGWDGIKEKYGHIPVTQFHLHDYDPYELLKSLSHVFELRMLARHMKHDDIRVVAEQDIPEQD